jgi:hypothetical protein
LNAQIDLDAQDLSIPGASIGAGTNCIPDIKTSIEMETIFVLDRSQTQYDSREVPSVSIEERVRFRCFLGPAKFQTAIFLAASSGTARRRSGSSPYMIAYYFYADIPKPAPSADPWTFLSQQPNFS